MKPYYQDEWATIYHGDCREILPLIPDNSVDLVLTDPPYGIGKAYWDNNFSLWWLADVARISKRIGIMCGTWNLLKCPERFGKVSYRWTLAAHLVNGMTRGRLGFGNWVPCVVYGKDFSTSAYRKAVLEWCRAFGDWCRKSGIKNNQLDEACGTSSMGDWWTGKSLPWCRLPSLKHWTNIRIKYNPPAEFDAFPANEDRGDYRPMTDCRDFVVGRESMPNHPTPKPIEVVMWFIETIKGQTILDPFLGSGTTAFCAKKLNRKCIGIEIEEKYCEIAAKRCSQGVFDLTK